MVNSNVSVKCIELLPGVLDFHCGVILNAIAQSYRPMMNLVKIIFQHIMKIIKLTPHSYGMLSSMKQIM